MPTTTPTPIRSKAEFKRRIQPGVKLHIENTRFPQQTRDTEVVKVQTNAFTTWAFYKGSVLQDEPFESWIYHGEVPADRFVFFDDGRVGITEPGETDPWIIYTFLDQDQEF